MAERKLLRIYLNDHLAVASAAEALARRMLRANDGTELGRFLAAVATDLADDLDRVEQTMQERGLKPSPVKRSVGRIAERLGRLKLNGRIFSYSPLSRLSELEGLRLLLTHNASLWRSLETIGDERAAGLAERAERHAEAVVPFRHEAAERALGDGPVE